MDFEQRMKIISAKQRNATFQLSFATTFSLTAIVLLETISFDILTPLISSYITPLISSIAAEATAATGVAISAAILTQIIAIMLIIASLYLILLAYKNITTDLHKGEQAQMPNEEANNTPTLDQSKSNHTKATYISFVILAVSIVILTTTTLAIPYLIATIIVAIIGFLSLIYSFAGKTLLTTERNHQEYEHLIEDVTDLATDLAQRFPQPHLFIITKEDDLADINKETLNTPPVI